MNASQAWAVCRLGRTVFTATLVSAVLGGAIANASISSTVFTIEATNASGTASYAASYDAGTWDPATMTYMWSLSQPMSMEGDQGRYVATLDSATLVIEMTSTLQIGMNFGVAAGSSDTTFTIESALVDFNSVPASVAEGSFMAGGTVYDDSGSDGMWLYEPNLDGTGAFQAYFNQGAGSPDMLFSDLLAVVGSFDGGMASGSQSYPGAGYNPFGTAINDMFVRADFVLTADDSAEGATTYVLAPEPTGLSLLLLGGLLYTGLRRR